MPESQAPESKLSENTLHDAPVLIFGEVLFDTFPDGRRVLGGAPFNVARHLTGFGEPVRFLSCVGDDAEGANILRIMEKWGMDTAGVQTDAETPTGMVRVEFDDSEPRYEIVHPSAWDRIRADRLPDLPASARMICHGSLALRDPVSAAALQQIRQNVSAPVYMDVNLRPPWWKRDEVLAGIRSADHVKLNHDELLDLFGPDGPKNADPESAALEALFQLPGERTILLTRGANGASFILPDGGQYETAAPRVRDFMDAVGAGDAFSAVMILGLLRGWSPDISLARAVDMAGAVLQIRGALPETPDFYELLTSQWT